MLYESESYFMKRETWKNFYKEKKKTVEGK